MTNPDYRALITEMAAELDHCQQLLLDDRRQRHPLADRARAALAQPEPEGPTDEQLNDIADETPWHGSPRQFGREVARAVLARWGCPAAAPVPVSERLPGPEDCDAEGRCWWLDTDGGRAKWVLCGPDEGWTRWLPANALPLPAPKGGEDQP